MLFMVTAVLVISSSWRHSSLLLFLVNVFLFAVVVKQYLSYIIEAESLLKVGVVNNECWGRGQVSPDNCWLGLKRDGVCTDTGLPMVSRG